MYSIELWPSLWLILIRYLWRMPRLTPVFIISFSLPLNSLYWLGLLVVFWCLSASPPPGSSPWVSLWRSRRPSGCLLGFLLGWQHRAAPLTLLPLSSLSDLLDPHLLTSIASSIFSSSSLFLFPSVHLQPHTHTNTHNLLSLSLQSSASTCIPSTSLCFLILLFPAFPFTSALTLTNNLPCLLNL